MSKTEFVGLKRYCIATPPNPTAPGQPPHFRDHTELLHCLKCESVGLVGVVLGEGR